MSSDKGAQSRKTCTAVSTDPTSTDGSYDMIRSITSFPRKEHSGDHNTVSKFVEAMNNPDWRRRREGYSSYDSMATTSSGLDWSVSGSGGSSQSHIDKDASLWYRKHRRPCPWDFCDSTSHWRSSLNSSEVGTRDRSVAPIGEDYANVYPYNMHTAVNKNSGEDIHGLCALLENLEIIDAPKGVRLLKLAPLFSEEGISKGSGQAVMEDGRAFPVARIQRARGRLPRWNESGDDIESVLMATNEGRPAHFNPPHHRSSEGRYRAVRSSRDESLERAREVVFKDPAVADVGSRVGEPREKTASVPSSVSDNPQTNDELSIRNRAFKKILEKLQETRENKDTSLIAEKANKKTDQGNDGFKKLLNRLQHGSGLETRYPGATPSEEHFCQPELSEKPHRVLQQQKDVSSDSELVSTYANYPKKKEWSHDSGVSMNADSPNPALNPRAREFLSFKNFTRASSSSDNPRISDEEFFQKMGSDKGSEESGFPVNQPVETTSTNLNHLPFIKPDCFNKSDERNPSLEASSTPVGGQGSAGFDLTSDMLSFSDVAFPFGACQIPMQSLAPPGFLPSLGLATPFGKWPPIPGFGSQFNLPTTNLPFQSCAVPPNPMMGINTTPQLPYNPTLGSSGYPSCPPPVSKPMFPNPIHQQKYEEYVEWRKANEPGYALACKSRQQRRAQRSSTLTHPTLGKAPHSEGQLV